MIAVKIVELSPLELKHKIGIFSHKEIGILYINYLRNERYEHCAIIKDYASNSRILALLLQCITQDYTDKTV